jgi:twitching motility protein PilT
MLDVVNRTRRVNVVTIEDPIEFIHQDRLALIHQREVGDDTAGFAEALRRVLRQDPDVILVGEMRDLPTIDAALKAAETGHLVLSTLHTVDATETVNRILDFYPGNLQRQVRLLLAAALRGIVSQRLLPRADGSGRVVATEILINNERVAERIADPELTAEIPDVIAQSAYYGMETFDQAILRLFSAGVITFAEGLRHSTKPADLRLRAQQLGLIPT